MPGFGKKLEGTAACDMRDLLWKARFEKKITLQEITDRLTKMDVPEWLGAQILQMVKFNEYNRCTDAVEQAMAQAIYNKIVAELKNGQ